MTGHCGTTSIAVDVREAREVGFRLCEDDTVAFWSWNLPFFAELVTLRQDPEGFPAGSGDAQLTLTGDVVYRFRPYWSGFFAACFDTTVETFDGGSGSASHTFGPWKSGSGCGFSSAIAVTAGQDLYFRSKTLLQAQGGAHVSVGGHAGMWDLDGERIMDQFELQAWPAAAVPEPSASLQLLSGLICFAPLAWMRRKHR